MNEMRIYIAYKYRYTKDKAHLQEELQQLSDYFESLGHKAFILGRDIQKWSNHGSKFSTFKDIMNNIGKHDMLFAFINSNVRSNGIPVEFTLAKIKGLRTVIARQEKLNKYVLESLADKVVLFSDINDLKEKIKDLI